MEKAVMVIGGGIAGIQASLDLAEKGLIVHLVEKTPSIGGRMAQLDKTFPTNDCSICILAPKMADCFSHPNTNVITYAEVVGVEGTRLIRERHRLVLLEGTLSDADHVVYAYADGRFMVLADCDQRRILGRAA